MVAYNKPLAVPPLVPRSNPELDKMDDALTEALTEMQPLPPSSSPGTPSHEQAVAVDAPVVTDGAPATAQVILLGRLLKTQDADLRKKDRDIRRLQDANQHLERENRDMHKFLADYGAPAATRAPLVPHAATSLPSSAAAAMVLIPLSVAPCRLAVGRPILQQDFQHEQCELQPRLPRLMNRRLVVE